MATTPNRRQGSHFASTPDARPGASRPAQRPSHHAAPSHGGATPPVSRQTPPSSVQASSPRPVQTRGVSARTARMTAAASPRTKAQRAQAASGKGSNKAPLVVGLVVAAVLVVVAAIVVPRLFGGTSTDSQLSSGQLVDVVIPEGSGASDIAKILKDAGVISKTDDFYKEVSNQKAESSLKSGTYSLMTGANVSDLVKQLVSGPNSSSAKLTVAEGLTLAKTAAVVESSLGISQADFLAQAKASNYVADYPFLSAAQDDSLEGFLCPKTYDFSGKDVTADSVIRAMLDQYKAEVASLGFASAEATIQSRYGITVSDYDLLTIASIIEKEAVTADDRPLVSSVFFNRLKAGMALQSDATMGYVTGGDVTADDLKQSSPYNTYLNKGLPPTPICSPSAESLAAALSPADTSYYYFLIIENGSYSNHTFSETYEQHQQAISDASAAQGQ